MNNEQEKNKVDAYITTENLKENEDTLLMPIPEHFDAYNNGLSNTLKQMADFGLKISKIYIENLPKMDIMIKSLTEISKKLVEMYDTNMKTVLSNITSVFEKIDWSKFDYIYKEIALKYLFNGFYPYRHTEIRYDELLNTNSKVKQTKIIKEGVRMDIIKNKKILFNTYPQYKKELNEIYKLYKNHNYRLCILSLINVISIINNSQFEYIDFVEKDKVRKKLLEKNIMKDKETNYMIFSPYIEDDDLVSANILIRNHKWNPQKYLDIPFNRNAILHGYSKKFGTEQNCLRWFSVLFNTMEISIKISENN